MILKEATNLNIIFFKNYKNPEFNSLKEYHEDIKKIKGLKRYIKRFFIKRDKISFHKLLNMFIFISNVFDENMLNEVLVYIAYKYFDDNNIFVLYANSIFYFFEIVIDENIIKEDYIKLLNQYNI